MVSWMLMKRIIIIKKLNKLLNIKISENNKKIDSLIADIKNCNFNTDMYNVDKELDRILNS